MNDIIISTICTMATTIISIAISQSKTKYRINQLEELVKKHSDAIDKIYEIEGELKRIN